MKKEFATWLIITFILIVLVTVLVITKVKPTQKSTATPVPMTDETHPKLEEKFDYQ
jgi:hypothetical protein